MSLPKFPQKHQHPSTFTASDLWLKDSEFHKAHFPKKIILTFQNHSYDFLSQNENQLDLQPPFGEITGIGAEKMQVGLVGKFGMGAPLAVFMLEWLAVLGAEQFIIVGFAGGLHETQKPGDLVLCSKALRDEGTSYHYLPPADFVDPHAGLSNDLEKTLKKLGYAHTHGPTWTIDAPMRETFAEIKHYRRQKILTVEMEAAALFAAAQYHQLKIAAAFAIGDTPQNNRWNFNFDRNALHQGLELLANAAVHTFENQV